MVPLADFGCFLFFCGEQELLQKQENERKRKHPFWSPWQRSSEKGIKGGNTYFKP